MTITDPTNRGADRFQSALDLPGKQLDLIARLAALEPAIDVVFPRSEEELRPSQLAELGFTGWETWGEAAPGVPFYLFGQHDDLKLDLGIVDQVDGSNWMPVHRNSFGPLSERQLATMARLRSSSRPPSRWGSVCSPWSRPS